MGTTLTAVYVGEQEVAIAHVGDSRAYCLRDGELLRLTDDHSLVDELMRQGRLTPEEAVEHPQRSVITRALGPEGMVEVDTRSFRARAGDVYLLCSDGLTTMLSEQQIAAVLLAHPRLRDAGEALIAAANEAGGRDNITVVLLRLEDVQVGQAPAGGEHDDDGRAAGGVRAASAPAPPVPPAAHAGELAPRPSALAERRAQRSPRVPRSGEAPAPRAGAAGFGTRAAGVLARGAGPARRRRLPGAAVGVLHRHQQPRPGDDVRGRCPTGCRATSTLYSSQYVSGCQRLDADPAATAHAARPLAALGSRRRVADPQPRTGTARMRLAP